MDSRLRSLFLLAAAGVLAYFLFFKKEESTPPRYDTERPVPANAERGGPAEVVAIRSGGLVAKVSTHSGAIADLYLDEPQFRDPRSRAPFKLSNTASEPFYPLRSNVVFERQAGHNVLPDYLTFTPVSRADNRLELVATPPGTGLEVRRTIKAHTNYALRVDTRIVNHGEPGRLRFSSGVYHYVLREEEGGHFFRQAWQRSEGMCEYNDRKFFREFREELAKRGSNNDAVGAPARFVGVGNLYFLYALAPLGNEPAACHLRAQDRYRDSEVRGSMLYAQISYPPVELGGEAAHEYRELGYFGPKFTSSLSAALPSMSQAVNLGFFSLIARGLLKLLQLLYQVVHNWGVAIILLTVIVRTALYPILSRSTKSLAVMQKLKPELDALNERYKDNQEQRGLATMELYRKHGVNPLSGCLPQLAQLPVWWALYTTLQTSVELFHAPFVLWWRDLSDYDHTYILPLVLGAVMFLQQKLMPPSMPDPVQQKMMMYFMPIFLTAISLFLPSGLALYMLVNSVLAIIQQKITKAQIDRMVGGPPGNSGSGIQVRPAPAAAGPAFAVDKHGSEGGHRGGRR